VLRAAGGLGKSYEPKFEVLKLRLHVDGIIRNLDPLATSAGITVSNEIPGDVEVYSDDQLLSQVLQNLLSNALKFTPQGTVEIGARYNEGSVECWVKDSGVGIASDQLDKVFDRFETTSEPERSGLGLGLAIVKEVVELHKGEIRVQSEVGKGSTFTFVLPRHTAAS